MIHLELLHSEHPNPSVNMTGSLDPKSLLPRIRGVLLGVSLLSSLPPHQKDDGICGPRMNSTLTIERTRAVTKLQRALVSRNFRGLQASAWASGMEGRRAVADSLDLSLEGPTAVRASARRQRAKGRRAIQQYSEEEASCLSL